MSDRWTEFYPVHLGIPCVIKIRTQWDLVNAPHHLAEQVRRQRQYRSETGLQSEYEMDWISPPD